MAMYANVNGASKLLAQTSAEAAGGGVTELSATTSTSNGYYIKKIQIKNCNC